MLWIALVLPSAHTDADVQAIALWALQYTPRVSQVAPHAPQPGGVLLEVHASLRLFDGLDALVRQITQAHASQDDDTTAQWAVAPTPLAAWALALTHPGTQVTQLSALRAAVTSVPICCLEVARAHQEALQGLGVRTLGELLALPRAGLVRRFSKALLNELDRVLGAAPDMRAWFVAPPRFECTLELAARVDAAPALAFAARRLLASLCGWLVSRHEATRCVVFELIHEDHPSTPLPLQLATPNHEEVRFSALLRLTLERTRLSAPVYALSLRCDSTEPWVRASGTLFPQPDAQPIALARLLERLQTRLGRAQVLRVQARADHRPEHACVFTPLDTAPTPSTDTPPVAPRPLWLLPEPQPWRGPPPVVVRGPERIEGGWWAGHWVARDYFVVRDHTDALLWAFKPRAPDAYGTHAHTWFVHGGFG